MLGEQHQAQMSEARQQRQSMADKRIPVTEAAQRVVEAVDEVVSYELRGNTLRVLALQIEPDTRRMTS